MKEDVLYVCLGFFITEVLFGLWLLHEGASIKEILMITVASFVFICICLGIMYLVGTRIERW